MPNPPTVFISYRRESSADLARYMYEELTRKGADVFFDVEDINGGRFDATIEREIINRQYFLVILAPPTLESEWVRREIETALKHGKNIIPVETGGFRFDQHVPPQLVELKKFGGIPYDFKSPETTFRRLSRALSLTPSTVGTARMPFVNSISSPKLDFLLSCRGVILKFGIYAAALLFAFIMIFSEQARTQLLYSLGLLTSTPTIVAVVPTHTPMPPTDNPSTTPTLPTLTLTPLPPSDTPAPSSPTPTTPAPLTPTDNQLTLIADEDSLTLYVPQQTDLTGLTFVVAVGGTERTYALVLRFQSLTLTNDIAEAGSCFRLTRSGSTPPLAGVCQDRGLLFTTPVGDSDVFWYDPLIANFRVVEVRRDAELIGRCTFAQAECNL